jgi:hypothetical protein
MDNIKRQAVINIKNHEIIRTRDLKNFYVIAKSPLEALKSFCLNMKFKKKDTQVFNRELSYVLLNNDEVYVLKK